MKPLNDVALIEIEKNQYEISGMKLVGGDSKKSIGSGILVELPKEMPFLGFHAFAFETSLGETETLAKLWKYYSKLIGKRVYWTALSERGMVFNKDDKSYALIKLTDFVGYSEPDEIFEPEVTEIKY